MTRPALLRLALATVAAVVAGLCTAPAFGGSLRVGAERPFAPAALVLAVILPAVVTGGLMALALLRGAAAVGTAVVGVVGGLLAVGLLTRPGRDVLAGPYRLVTSALPLSAAGPTLAAVGTVVVLVATTAGLLAVFARRPLLAAIPGVIGLGAAFALDAGAGEPATGWAIGVLVVSAGLVAADRLRTWRTAAAAVAVVAVAAAVAVLAGPSLPGHHRRDPADVRDLVAAPVRPRTLVSPLQLFPALRTDTLRIAVTGTTSARVDRLRLATMDTYDGRYWTPAPTYLRAGTELPAALHPSGPRVSAQIRVAAAGDLAGLLAPGPAATVSVDGLAVDDATGDVVVPAGRDYPRAYRVSGTPVREDDDSLRGARLAPLDGPALSGDTAVPSVIAAFARRAAGGPSGTQALRLLRFLTEPDWVRDDGDDAPGGHSLAQIETLLTGSRGTHAGTSEQYATAYALLVRLLGFHARVVMGFAPEYSATGRFAVSGKDVRAWAEVQLADGDWLTVDPTPLTSSATPRPTRASSSAPASTKASPTPAAPASSGPRAGAAGTRDRDEAAAGSSPLLLAGVAVLVVVLVVLLPGGVKTWRRRRRRRAPSTVAAVAGAWQESLDRLAERGVRVTSALTTAEVADRSPAAAAAPVRALGVTLLAAGFAPDEPEPAARTEAWAAERQVARTVWTDRAWRRAVAWFDPRPLWRR